jgi:hypothetical protein
MNKRFAHSIGGFALAETIAALAILAVVLGSLMTMVQYARVRAIANYHDRYVLLRLDGEMQRIRYQFQEQESLEGLTNSMTFQIPDTNWRNSKPIPVRVTFTKALEWDIGVADNVGFEKITATAEWSEHLPFFAKRPIRAERRYLALREDYFFKVEMKEE